MATQLISSALHGEHAQNFVHKPPTCVAWHVLTIDLWTMKQCSELFRAKRIRPFASQEEK